MATEGIEGLLVETHNWGKTVAFWKALGYEIELEMLLADPDGRELSVQAPLPSTREEEPRA